MTVKPTMRYRFGSRFGYEDRGQPKVCAPEVSGVQLVAKQHRRRADGLLDDPAGVDDAGYQLETVVPLPLAVRPITEEPAAAADFLSFTIGLHAWDLTVVVKLLVEKQLNLPGQVMKPCFFHDNTQRDRAEQRQRAWHRQQQCSIWTLLAAAHSFLLDSQKSVQSLLHAALWYATLASNSSKGVMSSLAVLVGSVLIVGW